MISQSPRTALNPVISVGHQISRLLEIHEGRSRSVARQRAVEMLQLVASTTPSGVSNNTRTSSRVACVSA